ncbi:MAG TPA: type II secretion system secretin GspD [Sideroxyarcus sp.]|nr:type II secretion system secretin GspD [Sideroxyarcus sp.]
MKLFLRSALLAGIALFAAMPGFAADDNKGSLNFVNADIPEVIRAISQISQKNFLVDPRVKGTINIVSATPVTPEVAYDILLSALRLQGYAAVESDGVTKIMPEADAKLYVGAVGKSRGKGDQLITKVFVLKNESASQLINVIRPMVSPNNLVAAYASNNTLVITDYASNIKRIEQVINSIDQPSDDTPIIIPVKNASAADLANQINKLMPEATTAAQGGDGNQRFVLQADSRTNNLILRSDNPARIARVRALVKKLDTDSEVPGNIHVIALKNAEAVKMAPLLRAVMSGDSSAVPAGVAPGNVTALATASGGGAIQADAASNSLIITASEPIYNNLRAVIERLDVRRPQIFVEALIVEVTADKAAEFGVQWQSLNGANKTGANIIGGTNFGTANNIIDASTNIGTVGQGLNVGVVKGTATLPGLGTVLNLGALAHALETDTQANILSAPNLMTLDNEEAKIVVGQNVPFVTGQYAQTGSSTTATPFQTIERKDVGLTLKIKPQIMEGGSVRLSIYQEVSSVSKDANTSGVVTNKRSIESNILVDKDQIVVLGGLIQDSVSDVKSQTPLLGDIPLLGSLFRYETRQRTKTNLMVFIRPYVMLDKESYAAVTNERYEQMRGAEKDAKLSKNLLLPVTGGPELPGLKLDSTMPGSANKPASASDKPSVEPAQ